MRVWNVSEKEISHLYNSRVQIIPANKIVEIPDDAAVFLLSKREIRGNGLVQVKDGDKKEERYAEGRRNIYNWAKEKYTDYERHCEEREALRYQPLKPHPIILEYKRIIDEYEKWEAEGKPVREGMRETIGEKRVYACPHCLSEFSDKDKFLEHFASHQESENGFNAGTTANQGKGKG